MASAFTKETVELAAPAQRMVGQGPNLVTPEGLAQIEGHVGRIDERMKVDTNVLLRQSMARDLRYWQSSKSGAKVVHP